MSTLEAGGSRGGSLWLVVALFALPPALIAVLQLGVLHPDEVYQALEPATHLAFGRGLLVWEWQTGLRNWAVPGVFAALLRLAALLRIDDPQARRLLLELPQYALHAAALVQVYRLVERRTAAAAPHGTVSIAGGLAPALWGVALVALYAPVLHFAGRTMSESYSTALLVIGLARIDEPARSARNYALGGLCLGLAVIARYGSAVVAVAAVLWLCGARRFRDAAYVSMGGTLAALLLGAIDLQGWGRPFYSLLNYFQFNVVSGHAARRFGAEPFWF